jgi:thioredoxin-dependent peroxiredoxin
MLHRNATLVTGALVTFVTMASAQAPAAQQEPGPKVGDAAPDFSLGGATRDGVLKTPVSLSKYRGQTVVVAFFPKARTSGCTAQMTHYRDKWAELFNGGKGVQVLAVSMDADTTQANWAKEANFPMTFVSDPRGEAGLKYGAWSEGRSAEQRLLFVVGPDGKVAFTAKPFKPMVEDSYAELGAVVKKVAGLK